jgi:predicted PurR-regulated permease PerM
VRALHRRRIPEPAAAGVCLFLVAGALVLGIMPLVGPAQQWLEDLPAHLKSADHKLQAIRERISQFSALRSRIAEMATPDEGERPLSVAVQQPDLTHETVILSTTGNTLGMFVVILVLTFFLLTSGDQLINRILSILPTFHEKRQTVELILDIQRGISSYLLTITMINIGLGVAIACALWLMGVPNPAMWGLLTTVFNYVPFLGQGVAGLLISLVALLTFDSVAYALLVPVVFYSIAAVEGNLITPALVGKHLSLNPILVLVALLFWGWLWGIAGAALAVPILAMAKISCDRFECTRSIGTLLGG